MDLCTLETKMYELRTKYIEKIEKYLKESRDSSSSLFRMEVSVCKLAYTQAIHELLNLLKEGGNFNN